MTRRKNISTYISSLAISLMLLASVNATAQNKKKQVAEPDTVPFFRGVAVSADLVGPIQMAASDYGVYEAALRVNLKDKYFPILELGYGKADKEDESTRVRYKTNAPYGRIGLDFNLLKNKHDIYRLYAGFRYAYTSFHYDVMSPPVTDPVWHEEAEFREEDIKASYHWLEAVFGVDAKIWGPFRLGWSLRYKSRISESKSDIGGAWYVPGYGIADGSQLGGTFNVIIEL